MFVYISGVFIVDASAVMVESSGVAYVLFLTLGASNKVYYVGRFTSKVVSNPVNCFITGIVGFECGVAV